MAAGLDEDRRISVAVVPVGAQTAGDGGQEVGGEVGDPDPGGDCPPSPGSTTRPSTPIYRINPELLSQRP